MDPEVAWALPLNQLRRIFRMKKLILAGTFLLLPSLVNAAGFVFASPKKEPYIKPTAQVRASAKQVKADVERTRECDPSYPTICLTPGMRGLSCRDIGFANFQVVGRDPHGFDRDHNGVGCEASMWRSAR
jgi:hypothetical protein